MELVGWGGGLGASRVVVAGWGRGCGGVGACGVGLGLVG